MRVLIVTSGQGWPGGIATHAALVARELHARGHLVAVASIGAASPTDAMPWEVVADAASAASAPNEAPYTFRHQVVVPAAAYVAPLPWWVADVVGQVASHARRLRPDASSGRVATAILGRIAAMVGHAAWMRAEAGFLERILLHTSQADLARLDAVRRRVDADVEYLTDLTLVPMVARLPHRRAALVAAAQGFELVARRGVPILPAIRAARQRIARVISGSHANVTANLAPVWGELGGPLPVAVVPYGVADVPAWCVGRVEAADVLRSAMPRAFGDFRGATRRFVIAWLSRIDAEKGADLALHVLALLLARGVDAELWLAGSAMPGGAHDSTIRSTARVLDLGDRLRLVGHVPTQAAKAAFLRVADAFLATFVRPEPFGLVVTEAMACGLPVVAPDAGGPGEVLRDAGLGEMLYPPGDTGAAASRLERLANDPILRAQAGSLARAAFVARWNAGATGVALEAVLIDAMNAAGKKRG